MNEKKIEPTQAMVDIVELADKLMVMDTRDLLRTALNHPDAPGLFADEADRPWEPLNVRRVYAGDEVRQDLCNVTVIAVVGEVDEGGDPRTAEGRLIGLLRHGTWYVRRAVEELPTEDGAVIVPADGSDFIEQVGDCADYRRLTYDAASGRWIGWDMLNHEAEALSPEYITPGTWKVGGK